MVRSQLSTLSRTLELLMTSLDKKLLWIALERPPAGLPGALDGWTLCMARTLDEAGRALRTHACQVGLLSGLGPAADPAALDRFLGAHGALVWLVLAAPGVLARPEWRELVRTHAHDFHTEPADPRRLAYALGHAHGLALLHGHPGPAPAAAPHTELTGTSAAITRLRAQVARVGRSDAPVLIWGESGSGKDVTAQAIHAHSQRAGGPFVPVNCGAMAPQLIQAELFGHVRGAFTGAERDKAGLIESANGGTIFLDEIADLPRELQSNLLRFLQEKTIYRVGSTRSILVDTRVIAASNINLKQAVAQGKFREDLYYRLNVLPVTVPPLRERRDDLPVLTSHFFRLYAADKPRHLKGFSSAAVRAIASHDWPGNVRELINRIRRAMVLAEGRQITPADLELASADPAGAGDGLGQLRTAAERAAIGASLQRAGSNITLAARDLGVSRMTLYRLMSKHGIAAAK